MSSQSRETKRLDNKCSNNENSSAVNVDKNGNAKRGLVHSVSIIVEPVLDDDDEGIPSPTFDASCCITGDHKGRHSPVIILDDTDFDTNITRKSSVEEDYVKSIMATARLRKQEFARLLEEHAQLVNEINRVETSLL
ncbi:hypothetical protein HDE_05493 [Halotydeus destructor]|nr:hypothetical protein HDE_05493 [Halotydeus destructor]